MIAGLALYTSYQPGGVTQAVPILGALALGAQRLLPLMQLAYSGWSSLMSTKHILFDTVELMQAPVVSSIKRDRRLAPISFQDDVALEGLGFTYGGDSYALADIDLTIAKGERIGFIGETGSGKSTLLDLLMGLLDPTEGRILIDNVPLNDASRANWQAQIAHVPQSDLSRRQLDRREHRVRRSGGRDRPGPRASPRRCRPSSTAFIDEPARRLRPRVGERGVRLSGGQRQRLGIARALYKQAPDAGFRRGDERA